jgi:two-component system, LytTR family, response regulator LytT
MKLDAMLRVLVLEDEWVARNLLVEMIEATGVASVVGAAGSFDDAVAFLNEARSNIDVVFVDIKLVGSAQDGLALIRQFAELPGAPAFVLATALREHALEAFNMGVVDYVLKPFDDRRVARCIEKLHAARRAAPEPDRPVRIIARNKRNLVFLMLDEVWALEASEGQTLVHSARGTFDIDLSLDTVASSFGRDFLRVHRNWLVSTAHILELERNAGDSALLLGSRVLGTTTVRVPIAKDRAANLRTHLMQEGIGIRRR